MSQRVSERPDHYPMNEFDASKWASEFMLVWGNRMGEVDEALMLSWFAAAIMTGHDYAAAQSVAEIKRLREVLVSTQKDCLTLGALAGRSQEIERRERIINSRILTALADPSA